MVNYDKRGNEYEDTDSSPTKKPTSESNSDSRADLAAREGAGNTSSQASSAKSPSELNGAEQNGNSFGDWFTGKVTPRRYAKQAIARRTAGGIIGLGSVLGLIGLGGIASGPLAIINAAASLAPNFSTVEDQSNNMTTRALIYAMLGNANKGRLGLINSKIADSYENKMVKTIGLRPTYNAGGTNRGMGFEIVDEDLARSSGALDALEKDGGRIINGSSTITTGDGVSTAGVDADGRARQIITYDNFRSGRSSIRIVTSATGTKGLTKFMMNRLSIKRAGVKLSVFNKLKEIADGKTKSVKERQREELQRNLTEGAPATPGQVGAGSDGVDAEGNPTAATDGSTAASEAGNAAASDAVADVNNPDATSSTFKGNLLKGAGGAAAVVGVLCLVRGISDGYPGYVYSTQILPLMRQAMQILAAASQLQAGENVNMVEVGAFAEKLSDKSAPVGQQEFSDNAIERGMGGKKGGAPIPGEADVSLDEPDAIKVADAVFEGGAANPANWACDLNDAASELPVLKEIGEASNFVIDKALSLVGTSMESLVGQLYQFVGGPGAVGQLAGGALGAASQVGSHLLAVDQATGAGARPISLQQYSVIQSQALQEIAYENSKKSIFDRYFNANNTSSLASAVIQKSPSSLLEIPSLLQGTPNSFGKSIASITSPQVSAADVIVQYKTPYVGFTNEEMEKPAFQDPNLNESVFENGDYLKTLNEKYGKCFGSQVDPATGALITSGGVNPVDDENGSLAPVCSDQGASITDSEGYTESELLRYRFYLAYATSTHAAACGANVESSCADFGASSATDTAADSSGATGAAGYGATEAQLEGLPQECKDGTASGSVRVLCVGAKYRDLVPYKLVHPYTGKVFSERWNTGLTESSLGESGDKTKLTLDCSLFIGTVLYDAYGIDFTTTSQNYNNPKYFQPVAISDVKPGDIIVSPGHIGIVNEPGVTVLDTGWIHPTSPVDDLDIHKWANNYTSALRYIGPNAEGTSVQVGAPTDSSTDTNTTTTPTNQTGAGVQLDGLNDLIVSNQFPTKTSVIPNVTNIVIHWFVSNHETPESTAAAFAGGTSVQFFVSESGKIMQLTQYANTSAGHAKNANDWSIGIEIGSPNGAGDKAPYNSIQSALQANAVQKAQVIKLTTALAKKFGIKNVSVGSQPLYGAGDTCSKLGLSFPGTCATQQQASAFGVVGHYQLQDTKFDPGTQYIMEIQKAVKKNLEVSL